MLRRIVSKMSDPEECKLCHNPEKTFRPFERLRNELTHVVWPVPRTADEVKKMMKKKGKRKPEEDEREKRFECAVEEVRIMIIGTLGNRNILCRQSVLATLPQKPLFTWADLKYIILHFLGKYYYIKYNHG